MLVFTVASVFFLCVYLISYLSHFHISHQAVTDERGKVLGAVPMEFRSNNFGPPLFCHNRSSFAHLDNRQNKSARILDTQWLFPKDTFRNRGRVSVLLCVECFIGVCMKFMRESSPRREAVNFDDTSLFIDGIIDSLRGSFFNHLLCLFPFLSSPLLFVFVCLVGDLGGIAGHDHAEFRPPLEGLEEVRPCHHRYRL